MCGSCADSLIIMGVMDVVVLHAASQQIWGRKRLYFSMSRLNKRKEFEKYLEL